MKKLLLMTACLLLLLEDKCYARIGETLEQCEKRYGKRITKKEELQDYAKVMFGLTFSRVVQSKIFGGEKVSEKLDESGGLIIREDVYYFFRLDEFVICVKLYNDKVDAIRFMKSFPDMAIGRMLLDDEKMALISANSNGEKCVSFMFSSKVLVIYTDEYNNKIEKQKELLKKEQDDKAKNVLNKF